MCFGSKTEQNFTDEEEDVSLNYKGFAYFNEECLERPFHQNVTTSPGGALDPLYENTLLFEFECLDSARCICDTAYCI